MFDNLEKKINSVPSQKEKDGQIIKKKAGRPPSPNMGRFHFKIDKIRHKELIKEARRLGTNKSSVANQLIQDWLDRKKTQCVTK